MPDGAGPKTREGELEAALRKIVGTHKKVIAYVTPGHPLMERRLAARRGELGPDAEAYPPDGFSEWHRATDEAAQLLGWPHREEVAREAGKERSVIR